MGVDVQRSLRAKLGRDHMNVLQPVYILLQNDANRTGTRGRQKERPSPLDRTQIPIDFLIAWWRTIAMLWRTIECMLVLIVLLSGIARWVPAGVLLLSYTTPSGP
jgi:hypothetical protein